MIDPGIQAAVDQLAVSARDNFPRALEGARKTVADSRDRDEALARLTLQYRQRPTGLTAAVAAEALLRLVEQETPAGGGSA